MRGTPFEKQGAPQVQQKKGAAPDFGCCTWRSPELRRNSVATPGRRRTRCTRQMPGEQKTLVWNSPPLLLADAERSSDTPWWQGTEPPAVGIQREKQEVTTGWENRGRTVRSSWEKETLPSRSPRPFLLEELC